MARKILLAFIIALLVRRPIKNSISWISKQGERDSGNESSSVKTDDDSKTPESLENKFVFSTNNLIEAEKKNSIRNNTDISLPDADIPDVNENLIIENQESDFQ